MAKASANFRFKQFEIIHQQSAMKVGTDGVLLGAWAPIEEDSKLMDVGTGSGLIALMLAQRNSKALIDAIEIEKNAYEEAKLNIDKSPWHERVIPHHVDFQRYEVVHEYDHIISNPPYFLAGTKSPVEQRKMARHSDTNTLTFESLFKNGYRLTAPSGKLSIIIPALIMEEIVHMSKRNNWFLIKKMAFIAKQGKEPERFLLCFSKKISPLHSSTLVHYTPDGQWSEDYKELTKSFYIKL